MTQEIPERPPSGHHTDHRALLTPPDDAGYWRVVCRDCIMRARHPSLRAAASAERAHLRAHPQHRLLVQEVEG